MIISRTPVRISFLGGGTDYPSCVEEWGGIVLGTTINKYSYITARKLPGFFDYKTRLMYSKLETVKNNEDIEHRVIREVIDSCCSSAGLEISHMADLPSSSGTGSSSTFIVGLIHALEKLAGNDIRCLPQCLYNAAIKIEQEYLQDIVGYQDSAWAAFGGMNVIRWDKDSHPTIEKIYLQPHYLQYFERSLLLFHTGILRDASKIASSYVPSLTSKKDQHYQLMDITEQGIRCLKRNDYRTLGNLIHQTWDMKKQLSPQVTNKKIDDMFNRGMSIGAFGGKLLGAGGGGCLLFIINPAQRDDIIYSLERMGAIHIDFEFEQHGSKIIYG